ncbi:dihydrouridine synthase [Chitinivibrio alkaliphilus ACht1]|uniref:tRNA-dihydrouridine synthase n=2 Tax=Chitinivibrio TaxID=1505231 RepID=U7D9P8_9BACT|nr:dihydrouridine synthase [Chitinivibrio alkaliphilus ACht1]
MAPLRGITTHTFRKIYRHYFHGIDAAMSPFIAPGTDRKIRRSVFADILRENNCDAYPLTPQILANTPEAFPVFIKEICREGYTELNWNLGCPFPTVTKKKKGSGLITHPEIIEPVLHFLSQQDISYTVKTRTGWSSPGETKDLLPLFEKYGCRELIIHGRTGTQMYSGHARRDVVHDLAKNTSIPVVYNGDIFSPKQAENIGAATPPPVGIMIGRGLLTNPFLPAQITGACLPPDAQEQLHAFLSHLCTAYEELLYGPRPVLGRMKEIWTYLQWSFPHGRSGIKKILKSQDIQSYRMRVDALFSAYTFTPPDETFDPAWLG